MPAIAERQMDKAATLLTAFMRKDEREFARNTFLQQTGEPVEPVWKLVGLAGNPSGRMMHHRTVEMIVDSHSKEPATRVAEPKDTKANGQGSRDGHEKQFLRLSLLRLTHS